MLFITIPVDIYIKEVTHFIKPVIVNTYDYPCRNTCH
jgi:hypothetical protein